MKDSVKKNEEQKKSFQKNNVHLHGFINRAHVNDKPGENGKTLVSFVVTTQEYYNGENHPTFHPVTAFIDDPAELEKFRTIQADCEANKANKGVEGYKPVAHTVEVDAYLFQGAKRDKDDYSVSIVARKDGIKHDVSMKPDDIKVRNHADIVGNIARIDLYEDKGFATVVIANHFGDNTTYVKNTIDDKGNKDLYDQLKSGAIVKGNLMEFGGQLRSNSYQKDDKMVYTTQLDVRTSKILYQKENKAETEKAEVKTEVKAEVKAGKAPAAKKAASKKATPKKKGGVSLA